MSNPREGPQGLCVNLVLQKRRYQPGLQRYRRTEMIWHFWKRFGSKYVTFGS